MPKRGDVLFPLLLSRIHGDWDAARILLVLESAMAYGVCLFIKQIWKRLVLSWSEKDLKKSNLIYINIIVFMYIGYFW